MKVSVLSLLGQVRRTLFIFQSLLDSVTPPLSDANGRERYRVLGTEGGFIFDGGTRCVGKRGETHRVSGASRLLGTFCQLVENELRNRRKAARKAGEGNVSFSPTMDEQVKGRGL